MRWEPRAFTFSGWHLMFGSRLMAVLRFHWLSRGAALEIDGARMEIELKGFVRRQFRVLGADGVVLAWGRLGGFWTTIEGLGLALVWERTSYWRVRYELRGPTGVLARMRSSWFDLVVEAEPAAPGLPVALAIGLMMHVTGQRAGAAAAGGGVMAAAVASS